ncbi:hypothetical protein HRR83_003640 [Exophiala dermatitidis]|uniref:Uncharacterized protein n=1 Tax=Exophiala dermatitidis TaxID=5970 RepID=A0AAN6EXJ5_EXODE|nr:hypothetical protein HRR74_002980 [Exophiala dermatitidis]KAJ4529720.1 hypothetical protein HRR73_000748 [Exophiala dermatitidis]KAJ4543114.1 hypothetical protein HRR77_005373 [Exophiala dermatitidis]KAJ4543614.1 hypothetical protein HRR76_001681 [Exophiala dermatitidis]KAJ4575078.1 hypothetical protein HRR79_002011 [Exophiala dermatitidis]
MESLWSPFDLDDGVDHAHAAGNVHDAACNHRSIPWITDTFPNLLAVSLVSGMSTEMAMGREAKGWMRHCGICNKARKPYVAVDARGIDHFGTNPQNTQYPWPTSSLQ